MTVASVTLAEPMASAASGFARVLFFGRIADVCGRSMSVAIPSHGCSPGDVKIRIAEQVEGGDEALGQPCIRTTVDQVMAGDEPWVSPSKEVAFLSTFSGG